MTTPSFDSALPADWSQFYGDLQAEGHIPDASSASVDQRNASFSGMHLDLDNIRQQISDSGSTPFTTTVYADVLSIPDDLSWTLQGTALLIIARRIEAGTNARVLLDYRTSSLSSLVLFADELVGSFEALAISAGLDSAPTTFDLAGASRDTDRRGRVVARVNPAATPSASHPMVQRVGGLSPGIQVSAASGAPAVTTLTWVQGLPAVLPEQFPLYLNSCFIYASVLYDQAPELALSMLTWTKEWSAQSPQADGPVPSLRPVGCLVEHPDRGGGERRRLRALPVTLSTFQSASAAC